MLLSIHILFALLIPWILGYSCLSFLFRNIRMDFPFKCALGYGLGFGLLTLWMMILSMFGLSLNFQSIGLTLLFFSLLFFLAAKMTQKSLVTHLLPMPSKFQFDPWVGVFILYIAYHLIFSYWRALEMPFYTWDELETMVYKAKAFFYKESLSELPVLPLPQYPLLMELSITWLALNSSLWHESVFKIIFPIFYSCFLTIQYFFLQQYTSPRWATFGVVLLVSSNLLVYHATLAYRDLTMLYFNCGAVLLLLMWNQKKQDAYLILASLFGGLAAFTKLEGTGYFLIHFLLLWMLLFWRKDLGWSAKMLKAGKFLLPGILILLIFFIFKLTIPKLDSAGVSNHFDLQNLTFTLNAETGARIGSVLKILLENLTLTGNWNILWVILLISLSTLKRPISIEIKILSSSLLLFFGLYIAGYSLTQHFKWISETNAALSRQLLHILPFVTQLIILINFSRKKAV